MRTNLNLVGLLVLFLLAGCQRLPDQNGLIQTECTLEAKVCPDGSSVGRVGPNCEFAQCPESQKLNNQVETFVPYTAQFEIYTNGLKRQFNNPMYLNQSEAVYIADAKNPDLIQIDKAQISWQDFFKTLPFSLTLDCLTTGTGQKFCTNEKQKLHFELNGAVDPNPLSKIIQPDDILVIKYE